VIGATIIANSAKYHVVETPFKAHEREGPTRGGTRHSHISHLRKSQLIVGLLRRVIFERSFRS
jgi:hypothetical protein